MENRSKLDKLIVGCKGTSNNSDSFSKDYCKGLSEEGVYDTQEKCMEEEGKKLAGFLDKKPTQDRFLFNRRRVKAGTDASEEILPFLGTKKGWDQQFRYPNSGGDIHIRTNEEKEIGTVHRDKCPPGEAPVRHIFRDYLFSKKEN